MALARWATGVSSSSLYAYSVDVHIQLGRSQCASIIRYLSWGPMAKVLHIYGLLCAQRCSLHAGRGIFTFNQARGVKSTIGHSDVVPFGVSRLRSTKRKPVVCAVLITSIIMTFTLTVCRQVSATACCTLGIYDRPPHEPARFEFALYTQCSNPLGNEEVV